MYRSQIAPVAIVAALAANCLAQSGTGFKVTGIAPVKNRPDISIVGKALPATPPYNGITYNGGPVMNNPNGVNVYFIWYGDWSYNRNEQKSDTPRGAGGLMSWAVSKTADLWV